jgi:hypothetical protein
MVRLIDNIPKKIVDDIELWVTGTKIPWFFFDHTLGQDQRGSYPVSQDTYTIADLPRLTHYFYPNSKTPQDDRRFIMPLTEWCRANILPPNYEVRRVMGNLTTQLRDAELLLNIPHVDSDDGEKFTFLYYVNDSDGQTVFFEDGKIVKEVSPVRGTGALFPSNTVHAGQVPCINKSRYVINIIFSKRD